jgi:hypothetical protein
MKTLFKCMLVALAFTNFEARAQSLSHNMNWLENFNCSTSCTGGTDDPEESRKMVARTNSGNNYMVVTGYYTKACTLTTINSGTQIMPSPGGRNLFVARYDLTGGLLDIAWLATSANDEPLGIGLYAGGGINNANDRILIAGLYNGNNILVHALAGNFTSGAITGGTTIGTGAATGFAKDGNNNFYVCGYYTSASATAGTTINNPHSGTDQTFIATMGAGSSIPTGNPTYGTIIQPFSSGGANGATAMVYSPTTTRIHVTGYYCSSLNFNTGSTTLNSMGTRDMFLTSFNPGTTPTFLTNDQRTGGTSLAEPASTSIFDYQRDMGWSLAQDPKGIYVTGNCAGSYYTGTPTTPLTMTFDSKMAASYEKCTQFVVAYPYAATNPTTSPLSAATWLTTVSNHSPASPYSNYSTGYAICGDGNYGLFVTGKAFSNYRFYGTNTSLPVDANNGTVHESGYVAYLRNDGKVYMTDMLTYTASPSSSYAYGMGLNYYDCSITLCGAFGGQNMTSSTFNNLSVNMNSTSSAQIPDMFAASMCAPLQADAGPNKTCVCPFPSWSTVLGTPSANCSNATFSWTPATGLSSSFVAQPTLTITNTGTYTYTLYVTDNCGNSTNSSVTVTANSSGCRLMSAPDQTSVDAYSIYPNPTMDEINIAFGEETEREITVMDITGRVVITERTSAKEVKLHLSGKPAGVYLLKISDPDKVYTDRLIKQ